MKLIDNVYSRVNKIVRRPGSIVVHSAAGYQQDACADDKDCTDDVEDRGTHTTSGGKFGTLVVLDSDLKSAMM